ncbi:hypothetical protein KCU76_g82, partial [Aureobasidium melanogenum]
MSEYQEEKAPPLKTVVNFRDVASLAGNIKPGLLYRSANLDDATQEDLDNLRERYRIRSIIDLRGIHDCQYQHTRPSIALHRPRWPTVWYQAAFKAGGNSWTRKCIKNAWLYPKPSLTTHSLRSKPSSRSWWIHRRIRCWSSINSARSSCH